MIPIKDYIRKCEDKNRMYDWSSQVLDYFGEEYDEWLIEHLDEYHHRWYDMIYDSLKSHDVDSFKKAIENRFAPHIKDIGIENKSGGYGSLYVKFDTIRVVGSKDFKELLDFFNYNKDLAIDGTVWCEPDYPEKCNEETDNLFRGKFFHVTTRKNAWSILRNGLRIREKSDSGYRKCPKRIQLKGSKTKEELIKFAKELQEDRIKSGDDDWKDACVLMVDLKDTNFYIYRDHVYPKEEHCYFIYNNVHPSDIKMYIKEL